MPLDGGPQENPAGPNEGTAEKPVKFCICMLTVGQQDSLGETVLQILFRGCSYAIYRSIRGVYVHFADNPEKERAQRRAYSLLADKICELRYFVSQMHRRSGLRRLASGLFRKLFRTNGSEDPLLFDYNLAQAMMLLMESVEQTEAAAAMSSKLDGLDNQKKSAMEAQIKVELEAADATQQRAITIASRALEMAIARVTTDNTIRYIQSSSYAWFSMTICLIVAYSFIHAELRPYVLAGLTGAVGALFSVISRAQAFELKPCDDSRYNKLLALVRVGMGIIAGPALLLLFETFLSSTSGAAGTDPAKLISGSGNTMYAVLGLVGGFAERLVPNIAQNAASKLEGASAATPAQAATKGA